MRFASLLVTAASIAWLVPTSGLAQSAIHPYLASQLDTAKGKDRLPVYFVMADRLRYDHWFPRVNRMHIDERRRVVVAELKAHAARTQAPLVQAMRELQEEGEVAQVYSNWVGNFVCCQATPSAIFWLSALPGVEEVRANAKSSAGKAKDGAPHTEDREPVPAHGVSPRLPGPVPGNATINTKASQVWALGFRGAGVIAMNADNGVSLTHGDLVNRLWTNSGEIPGNGIDDDHNGHIDDIHGWDFFNNQRTWRSEGHGMLTAGALVGDGSCSGTITGQAPAGQLMIAAIGPLPSQGGPISPGNEVAQWAAIQYAINHGAHVQTSSHSYKNDHVPPPNYKMHREVGNNSLAAGLIRTQSPSNQGCPTSGADQIPFAISAPGCVPPPYLDPAQTLVGQKSGVIAVGAHDVTSNQLYGNSPCGPFAWNLADLLAVLPTYPTANWDPSHNDYPWQGGTMQGLIKPDITGPTNGTTLSTGLPCGLTSTCCTSTATPQVGGVMMLWKGANMSLKPEDAAMILHQTAVESGSIEGKENRHGAGRVDALAGLHLALCVHRVNGEPAWRVDHQVGTGLTLEVDTVPNSLTAIAVGPSRTRLRTYGGVFGIAQPRQFLFVGSSGPSGDAAISGTVNPSLIGMSVFSQCFTDDQGGATGQWLSSNVIEIRLVP